MIQLCDYVVNFLLQILPHPSGTPSRGGQLAYAFYSVGRKILNFPFVMSANLKGLRPTFLPERPVF